MTSIAIAFAGSVLIWLVVFSFQKKMRRSTRPPAKQNWTPVVTESHARASVNFVMPLLALLLGIISLVIEPDLREALSGEAGTAKTALFVLLCVSVTLAIFHLFKNSGTQPWKH